MPRGRRYYVKVAMLVLVTLAAAITMGTVKIGTRRASVPVATASKSQASNGAVDIVAARRRDDFAAMWVGRSESDPVRRSESGPLRGRFILRGSTLTTVKVIP